MHRPNHRRARACALGLHTNAVHGKSTQPIQVSQYSVGFLKLLQSCIHVWDATVGGDDFPILCIYLPLIMYLCIAQGTEAQVYTKSSVLQ